MSYCRFGEGDVYLYSSGDTYICALCLLQMELQVVPVNHKMDSPREVFNHMIEHKRAGHDFPSRVFERLAQEIRFLKGIDINKLNRKD